MKKTNLLMILLLVLPLQLIAQVVGENKSFRAQYSKMGGENLRYRTFDSTSCKTIVHYNKKDQFVAIISGNEPILLLVRNFRQEYIQGNPMNCMNMVQYDDFGTEEVVGCVWWDENKFIMYALGNQNDKAIIFYNEKLFDKHNY